MSNISNVLVFFSLFCVLFFCFELFSGKNDNDFLVKQLELFNISYIAIYTSHTF